MSFTLFAAARGSLGAIRSAALCPALALALELLAALAVAAPAPASAGTDRDYFQQRERETQRRAAEEQWFDQMREGWHARAREREILRQERVPAFKRAPQPTDRLSGKLHPTVEPLGHLSPGVQTQADRYYDAVTPSRLRLVPRSLQEFQRYRSQSR